MPSRANQVKENKDDQEEQKALEEGEEAGSNKAAAASGIRTDNPQQTVRIVCHEMSAPKGTTRPEERISNSRRAAADQATALFET